MRKTTASAPAFGQRPVLGTLETLLPADANTLLCLSSRILVRAALPRCDYVEPKAKKLIGLEV
jgi:hypothetical protein